MITIIVPLLVLAIGALVYGLSGGKVSELGRISFFVGLLWLVYEFAGNHVHLLT